MEIALKCILAYHKCLSVHLAVHINCISKTIDVIMEKMHIINLIGSKKVLLTNWVEYKLKL